MKRKTCYYLIGGCLIAALLTVLVPISIDGNWKQPLITDNHLCDSHSFLQFKYGQVFLYHGQDAPESWGSYRKIGWNKYEWICFDVPVIVRTSWFFSITSDLSKDGSPSLGYRDWHVFEVRRILAIAPPPKIRA